MNDPLLEALSHIQADSEHLQCVLVPSSFFPSDRELAAVPIRPKKWNTLMNLLSCVHSQGTIVRLPPFLQFTPLVHAACKEKNVPIFVNDLANMPLGARAIKEKAVDVVVTEFSDVEQFSNFCLSRKSIPKAWFIIYSAYEHEWRTLPPMRAERIIAHEIHLIPGIPILEQCTSLMKKNELVFHLSQAYNWSLDTETVHISSKEEGPLTLSDFTLPFTLKKLEDCSCGQPIYSRKI